MTSHPSHSQQSSPAPSKQQQDETRHNTPPMKRMAASQTPNIARVVTPDEVGEDELVNNNNKESLFRLTKAGMKQLWGMYFLVAVVAILSSVWANLDGSKKYTPVSTSLVDEACNTVYLNILSDSRDEDEAVVCCNESELPFSILETSLCSSKHERWPLASRLAKFPEALLVPLLPVLLRLWFGLTSALFVVSSKTRTVRAKLQHCYHANVHTLRRLGLYCVISLFRMYVLYSLFNEIEDMLVGEFKQNCWFHEWLPHHEKHPCFGRAFDFSDHMVLFYGQILPISMAETVHALARPYTTHRSLVVPVALVLSHVYVQFLTATGVYKTGAYFHTPGEVVAGFGVSTLVSVPLLWLQCGGTTVGQRTRDYFFR